MHLGHHERRGLGVALLFASARARTSKVDMHGQCASVARSNVWVHEVRDVDPITGDDVGPILESTVLRAQPHIAALCRDHALLPTCCTH